MANTILFACIEILILVLFIGIAPKEKLKPLTTSDMIGLVAILMSVFMWLFDKLSF